MGAWLLSIGAVGMGADAVYHQVAYEMTADGIDRLAVTPVMLGMQTRELRTLAPLLVAFLLGAPVLGIGWIADRRSRLAGWLLASPLLTIPAGAVAVRAAGLPRRVVVLAVLGRSAPGWRPARHGTKDPAAPRPRRPAPHGRARPRGGPARRPHVPPSRRRNSSGEPTGD